MIEGGAFKKEVKSKNIMAVPTVHLNGDEWGGGRMELEEILNQLGSTADQSEFEDKDPYDVLVVGGGPTGGSAAIYVARKCIRTGMVTDRFGGQILDTSSIEIFISVKETSGDSLAASIKQHVDAYNIDVMNTQRVKDIESNQIQKPYLRVVK